MSDDEAGVEPKDSTMTRPSAASVDDDGRTTAEGEPSHLAREGAVALGLLLVSLAVFALLSQALPGPTDDPQSTASRAAVAEPTASAPVIPAPALTVVLSGSSLPSASITEALAGLGRPVELRSEAGAGFAATVPPGGRPLVELVAGALSPGTRLLVLQGGEADNVAGPGELEAALARMLDTAAATSPQAAVVLIGPIPSGTGEVPASMRRVNDTIAEVARTRSIAFIDALAAGWRSEDDLTEPLTAALAAVLPAPSG